MGVVGFCFCWIVCLVSLEEAQLWEILWYLQKSAQALAILLCYVPFTTFVIALLITVSNVSTMINVHTWAINTLESIWAIATESILKIITLIKSQ